MNRGLLTGLVFVIGTSVFLSGDSAFAQFGGSSARNLRNATSNYLYNRPTVSPYLNLTTRSIDGSSRYFTQVRPQLEQQQQGAAQQRQAANMQRQISQTQDQLRQTQQQTAGMMITGRMGWSARGYTRFGTYMNFYPGFNQIRRR